MGAFGEKLRKQRERRGIELEAISNTTKISTRMLRALEDEHFDQLPGGVFNKGFVRAYARQIGLNEEEAVTDYLAALRESQLEQQSVTPDFRAPVAKPAPVAAPVLGNQPLDTNQVRDKVLPIHDLPAPNPIDNNDDAADRKDDRKKVDRKDDREDDRKNDHEDKLRTDDLTKQAHPADDRSNEDHDSDDRRNELRRNEDRRNEERRNEDRRIEARRREARRREARRDADRPIEIRHRPNQNQTKVFPTLPDSATQPRAANPSAPRFRQKYPAGDPAPSDPSAASIPWGKLALALLLVTLILAFWNFHRHAQPTAASPPLVSPNQSPAPDSASPPANSAPAPLPASPSPGPSANQLSPAAAPATSSANSASQPSPGASQPDVKPGTRTPARTPTAKPPATFTLQVRAEESTWISLTADGKPIVTNETLIAPAQTSVRATQEIVVKTGNAAAISFLLNGKAIPPQGNEGEPRTYVVDATGVHVVTVDTP